VQRSMARVLVLVTVAASAGCARLSGLADLEIDDCMNQACDPATTASDASGDASVRDASGGAADGAPGPSVDGASDAGGGNDAGGSNDAGGGSDDGGSDASADVGVDAPVVTCGGTAGPAMVRVAAFCIDSTEVTNHNYADFLASPKGQDVSGLPASCAYKSTLTPSSAWPANPTKVNDPVVYVDWCDAYAYCAYAGKRLCGAIAGGPSTLASLADRNVDAWYAACSGASSSLYPYGPKYVTGKCNDYEGKANGTRSVGSYTGCQGGYAGVFDMSGNAYEWEDACAASVGPSDSCIIRGGSWLFSGAQYGACSAYYNDAVVKRSDTYNDTGFRCCSK
jgi:sulfatase modifying factor 1